MVLILVTCCGLRLLLWCVVGACLLIYFRILECYVFGVYIRAGLLFMLRIDLLCLCYVY